MPTYKKVKLKNGLGEYVYPEIDPGDAGGALVIEYTYQTGSGSEEYLSTTTWEEAYAAFSAGRSIINHCASGILGREYYQRVIGMRSESGEEYEGHTTFYSMTSDTGYPIEGFMGLDFNSCSSYGAISFGCYQK